MPVRIPRIQQIQPAAQAPERRLDVRVQDQSGAISGKTQALTSLAKTGADLYQNYENDKINQINNEVEQSYNTWNTEQLINLRKIKGDPTDAYVQYEEAEKEKYQELLSARPDLNERVKRHVTDNLDKVQTSYRMKVLKQRGMQQEVYKNNLFNSTVKLKKNSLPTNGSFIVKGDQGSFLPFDQNIADIKTLISKRGLEDLTVKVLPDDAKSWSHMYRDGDGKIVKVSMDNTAKQRVAKELSEGVAASVNAMIDGGEKDKAKLLHDRYKSYIDPKSNSAISKKFDKETKRDEAISQASRIEVMPKGDQAAAINKIKDFEVRSETRSLIVTNNSKRAKLKSQQEDFNGDEYLKELDALKEAGRINGVTDLETSPTLKALWPNLSRKLQKSIKEDFKSPKTSNPEALVKAQDIVLGDVTNISSAKFEESLIGLNDARKNEMRRLFRSQKLKAPESIRLETRARKILKTKLYRHGLIEDDYAAGKLTKDSFLSLTAANEGLLNYLDGIPGEATQKELGDHIDNYIKEAKKLELFGGFFGDPEDFSQIPPATQGATFLKDPMEGLTDSEIRTYQISYRQRTGSFPRVDDPAFKRYIGESRSGR